MTPIDAIREAAVRHYRQVIEGATALPLDGFMQMLGTAPAYNYPVASAERNMFRIFWAACAMGAGLFEDHWEKTIAPAVNSRLVKTPYTNYAGD